MHITNPQSEEGDERVEINSPFSAKEEIKSLDWEETHREWDANREVWKVDLDSVDEVVDAVQEEYDVNVRSDVQYWNE